jgi:hypothetical protein
MPRRDGIEVATTGRLGKVAASSIARIAGEARLYGALVRLKLARTGSATMAFVLRRSEPTTLGSPPTWIIAMKSTAPIHLAVLCDSRPLGERFREA